MNLDIQIKKIKEQKRKEADKNNKDPKIFCDELSEKFKSLTKTLNLSNDDFSLMTKYFSSFGIDIVVTINNILSIDTINEFDINNLPDLSKYKD